MKWGGRSSSSQQEQSSPGLVWLPTRPFPSRNSAVIYLSHNHASVLYLRKKVEEEEKTQIMFIYINTKHTCLRSPRTEWPERTEVENILPYVCTCHDGINQCTATYAGQLCNWSQRTEFERRIITRLSRGVYLTDSNIRPSGSVMLQLYAHNFPFGFPHDHTYTTLHLQTYDFRISLYFPYTFPYDFPYDFMVNCREQGKARRKSYVEGVKICLLRRDSSPRPAETSELT